MKKNKTLLNILILLLLNIALTFFDYYVAVDFYKMISSEWYLIVLLFFVSVLLINPFISYLIDYYIILNHI